MQLPRIDALLDGLQDAPINLGVGRGIGALPALFHVLGKLKLKLDEAPKAKALRKARERGLAETDITRQVGDAPGGKHVGKLANCLVDGAVGL